MPIPRLVLVVIALGVAERLNAQGAGYHTERDSDALAQAIDLAGPRMAALPIALVE